MKKLLIATIALVVYSAAYAGQGTHWRDSGAEGPKHWGKLDPIEAHPRMQMGE